jgi:hypothetical protein
MGNLVGREEPQHHILGEPQEHLALDRREGRALPRGCRGALGAPPAPGARGGRQRGGWEARSPSGGAKRTFIFPIRTDAIA